MKKPRDTARRPRLTTDRRAIGLLLFVLDLTAIFLVLFLVKPLGSGPTPLPPSAYSASSDAARVRGTDELPVGPATHLLEPLAGKKSKMTLLFHRPLDLRIVFEAGPAPGGSPVLVELMLNGRKQSSFSLPANSIETTDIELVRGDRLTVGRTDGEARTSPPAALRIRLAGRSSHRTAYTAAALVGAFLLLVLQGRGRPTLSVLALVTFGIATAAETLNFGPLGWLGILSWGTFCFAYFLMLDFVCAGLVRNRLLSAVATVLFSLLVLVVPVFYFGYHRGFGSPVDTDILNAVFQTNLAEAVEFVAFQFGVPSMAMVVTAALATLVLSVLEIGRFRPLPPTLLAALCALLLLALSAFQVFALPMAQHVVSNYRTYASEIAAFERALAARQDAGFELRADKPSTGERYVLVIGESQTRESMGLYGYVRPTTPRLSELAGRGELLVQRNAYSSHTHTMETLSLALTAANQISDEGFFAAPSILDIARGAGFSTCWISNQAMYGPWDNMVSVLAVQADTVHKLNTSIGATTATAEYDEAVIPHLVDFLLASGDDNRLVIVHLMGNHGNYCDRYPENFSEYRGELPRKVFGALSGQFDGRVNCYDNSILYNDYVVDEIIGVLKEAGGTGAMMYFADHADDVLAGKRHASSEFTYGMTEIPVMFWLSEGYREDYPERARRLGDHMNLLFSNDLVYDTLIGLMGVSTEAYSATWDLSSEEYLLEPSEATTLSGKRRYVAAENRGYNQRVNLGAIADAGLGLRVIPHRVDTIGKLSQVCRDGAVGAEIDVHLDPDSGTFLVGHDADSMTGGTLDELLSLPCAGRLQKIWLDVKNLSTTDGPLVAEALLALDRTHSLRGRAIVETSNPAADLGLLREAGFHTSYYLPTNPMLTALKDGDTAAMAELADRIADRVSDGRFDAVSFDAGAYPFVSSYLVPRLDPAVAFHTWDLPTKLWRPHLLNELRRRDVFADPRVATILLPYDSPFSY